MLGQQVIVENRAGASQKIGVQSLLRAPKDGYTLAAVSPATLSINPLIDRAIGYNPLKDFTLLTCPIEIPYVLVVHPSVPARSLGELVAYAKANPRKLSYGSGGTGTHAHFSTQGLMMKLGIDVLHVPYKSAAPAFMDLLGGQISILMTDMAITKAPVVAGKLIALAVSGSERSEQFPNVPTFKETGIVELKDYTLKSWVGFIAPAGIPNEAAAKLQDTIAKVLRNPKVQESFKTMGFQVVSSTSEQFTAQVRSELDYNQKLIESGVIKIDN